MDIHNQLSLICQTGIARLIASEEDVSQYGINTFGKPQQFAGAIQVLQESAIPQLLSLANSVGAKLHPVSTNNNWGYGSILVDKDPVYLLDLSALNAITPTNKELGLITIGPGVTQQQLHDYLVENDWPHMVPVTGAGPSCSLLSNALERGYGITPYTDHFYACNAVKAYLPHPDLCEQKLSSAVSALDQSGNDFIDKTFKWGLGPYIDGLFTQSNLGVVTEMTLRLAKKPSSFCAFYIQIFEGDNFAEAVSFIRDLLESQSGMVGSINLMDKRRLVSMTCENPNVENNPIEPLSDEQVNKLADSKRLPEWMIVGSIYGEQPVVNFVKKYIKQKGKKLGRILFSDSLLLKFAHQFVRLPLNFVPAFKDVKGQLTSLKEGIDIMLGEPNQVALPLPYWRNKSAKGDKSRSLDPASENCGLLWYAPLIPMDPNSLKQFVSFVRSTMLKYKLDPLITFTNLKHDCIDSTVPLVFDKSDSSEETRALNCLHELITEGCKNGFVPYRLPIHEQQQIDKSSAYWQTIKVLKNAMDPNNILSPGKYDSQ